MSPGSKPIEQNPSLTSRFSASVTPALHVQLEGRAVRAVWARQDASQRHNDLALWGLLPLLRRHPPRLTVWQRDVVGATLHQLVPAVWLLGAGRPKDNGCYWGLAVDAQADIRAPERSKLHDEVPLPASAETSRHGTLGVQTGQLGRTYPILSSVDICPRSRPVADPCRRSGPPRPGPDRPAGDGKGDQSLDGATDQRNSGTGTPQRPLERHVMTSSRANLPGHETAARGLGRRAGSSVH
jgi:hypothetical protein